MLSYCFRACCAEWNVLDLKWGRSVCGVLSHQIHVAVFLLYIQHGSTSPVYRNYHLHVWQTSSTVCCRWQGTLKESSKIELIWGAVLKTNDLPRAEWAGLLTMAEWLPPARNLTNRGVRTQILDWSDNTSDFITIRESWLSKVFGRNWPSSNHNKLTKLGRCDRETIELANHSNDSIVRTAGRASK